MLADRADLKPEQAAASLEFAAAQAPSRAAPEPSAARAIEIPKGAADEFVPAAELAEAADEPAPQADPELKPIAQLKPRPPEEQRASAAAPRKKSEPSRRPSRRKRARRAAKRPRAQGTSSFGLIDDELAGEGAALFGGGFESKERGETLERAPSAASVQRKRPQAPAATADVAAIERAFRRRSYAEAIEMTDRALGDPALPKKERARLLSIKARSLRAKGDAAGADRVLDRIEREHEAYYRAENLDRERPPSPSDSIERPAARPAAAPSAP